MLKQVKDWTDATAFLPRKMKSQSRYGINP